LAPSHKAKATLALAKLAVAGAHIALNAPVLEPMPMPGNDTFQSLGSSHSISRHKGMR
jgi:hypothetical protein